MNKSYFDSLTQLLSSDPKFVVDGELNKNIVAELARKYDEDLLSLLSSDEKISKLFFSKINKNLVFKKDIFLQFISQKEFLPDSYTAFSQKIGLSSGDMMISDDNRVVLNWPYKDCVLEGGQTKEDQKRSEVFFNEILAPDQINTILDDKVFTNWKRYDNEGEHKLNKLKPNDNLIIKGNNLVVLHSLKKRFAGRIKLIYIDPPFFFDDAKDSDSFGYNPNFKLSTWLTFMKNRLEVARKLLSEDGIMMVHVGAQDEAYVSILLDEVFGRENLINHITMTTTEATGFKAAGQNLVSTANNLFIYKKSNGTINKIYIPRPYDSAYRLVILNKDQKPEEWKYLSIRDVLAEELKLPKTKISDDLIADYAVKNADRVFRTTAITGGALKKRKATITESKNNKGKVYIHPGEDIENFYILNGERISFYSWTFNEIDGMMQPSKVLTDVWSDISWTGIANEGGIKLNNGKKPEKLMERILHLATEPDDIVLDYHLGSGTTAAVAHKMGRQYIGIEQLYYGDNDSIERLKNVIAGDATGISRSVGWNGGGSFVYCNIKNDANEFREEVRIADESKMADLLKQALSSSFLSYRIDPKKVNEKEFEKLSLADKKRLLTNLVDTNTLYVNYSEIDDSTNKISKEDKRHNREFYGEDD